MSHISLALALVILCHSPSVEAGHDASGVIAPAVFNDADLLAQSLTAFGLNDGTLIDINLPEGVGNGFVTVLPVDGDAWTLDLRPHSILSPEYKLLVQIEGGAIVEETPAPIRTVRGVVAEMNDSVFAGSLLGEGLAGVISLSDGRRYWIEPVGLKLPGIRRSLHILYMNENVNPSGGTCASDAQAPQLTDENAGAPRGAACGTGLCFAELATDADFEYYQRYGSNVTNVENRIQLVVNTMNVEYERDVQITHVITTIVVRTTSNDPYTTTNSDGLVTQVRNEWLTNFPNVPRDITQLFTDRDIDGTVIGQAFNIAIVCTNQAYSYAQSDCCGSLSCASDLHAHENGHVWGGFHCNPCANTTMHTPLQCANVFGQTSIDQISAHRDSRDCLSSAGSTALPFFDDFPTTSFDIAKWGNVGGATIETTGQNPPSAPFSMNIDGTDTVTTNVMNAINAANGSISFYWQRRGGGNSPETGDDLVVEYLNNTNNWINLVTFPGSGPDMTTFTQASFPFPSDGIHSFFRLRFRNTSTQANTDDYNVDNVYIDAGDINPPTPNPMSFSIPPAPNPASPATQMNMEATLATDAASGPVQYFFQRITGLNGDSGWQSSRSWTSTVPVPNTAYSFRVKARDGAPNPNETAWSSPITKASGIETPTGIAASGLTGSGADLTAQGTLTNLGLEMSGLFFEVRDGQNQPVGVNANIWTNLNSSTTVTISGLQPLTQYSARVKARNREGLETPFTSAINFTTTDVTSPGAPILSNAGDNSMQLTINTNGNPGSTQYAIQCTASVPNDSAWTGNYLIHASGTPNGGTPDWQTAGAPVQIVGLQPATLYTFHVKARNAALVETPFGPTASLSTTTLVTPAAPILSGASATTISLTIGANGNGATTQYAIRCAATTPLDSNWHGLYLNHASGAPNGAIEDWQAAGGPITVNGLKPNTRYTFEARARHASGAPATPFGPTAGLATLALVPGEPLPSDYPLSSVQLDIIPDDDPVLNNPSDTTFAVQCISSSPVDAAWNGEFVSATGTPFVAGVWKTETDWNSVTIRNLRHDTQYAFAVRARNRDLVETPPGTALMFTTGADCNANDIADARELAECMGNPACSDCNANSVMDQCEIGFTATQNASSVISFSSQYDESPPAYLAVQTLGVPNVDAYGDNSNAWAPFNADDGVETISVGYDIPVFADSVFIRESLGNGFVTRVEVIRQSDGVPVEVWPLSTGQTDSTPQNQVADFTISFAETAFLVSGVKVTIDTTHNPGDYEEIDAIRLHGRAPGIVADANGNSVPDECEAVIAPNAPILTSPSLNGMDIAIAADANPTGTEYALRCTGSIPADANWDAQYVSASGTPSAAETWQTAAAWGALTLSGMQPGTEYSFSAKARVFVETESPFGASASLSTIPIPTGACCAADGSCIIATSADCATSGGVYQGDSTGCEPNLCPQPMGACCASNGSCSIETSTDCATAGGVYQGDDTVCTPNPCPQPTGACCATNGGCAVTTSGDCLTSGGTYQGDDTTCEPNLCPQPTGACCASNGACSVVTSLDCAAADGVYQGDDTTCTPNPCPQPCNLPGDVNDDGLVDGGDIAGFMRARLNIAPEPGENPACADFGNGDLDLDVVEFVTALIGA